ncbi:MAG: hypothetical protein H6Q68_2991 [Firmicutes bacterium]|nr:hypothetical protein [Bacillota bacterium]
MELTIILGGMAGAYENFRDITKEARRLFIG